MYSLESLEIFRSFLEQYNTQSMAIKERLIMFGFQQHEATKFAKYGAARRLSLLTNSVNLVFHHIPPSEQIIPQDSDRDSANLAIHSFIINSFGFLDNLAHTWNSEVIPRDKNENLFEKKYIGLQKKNKSFRKILPEVVREILRKHDNLFNDASNIRDHLAHKLPPYVVPFILPAENEKRYKKLDQLKLAALRAGDVERHTELEAEQKSLCLFHPIISLDVQNEKTYIFHELIRQLFLALIEIADVVLVELKKLQHQR
ncbi:hypothetical protein [Pseudovibrio sp. SCP19]|uniref:hypothetical protein n=1 Tax=Pseudovibrio sp. SCP19 TaxID=3141374 RepID=UPI00333B942B